MEKIGTLASQKNIQYEVYNPITLEKLDLSICTTEKINIYIPVTLSDDTLELHKDLLNYGYDLFNPNDSFYQDICAGYTSVNGTDVLLSDRQSYFNDTETACQENCTYSQYSIETKQLKCECNAINATIEPESEKKFDGNMIITSFYEVLKYSNFLVLKCFKLVFSSEGQSHNWGSMIIIGYFAIYTIFNVMYFIKGFYYARLYSAQMLFNNQNINNNEKNSKENLKKANKNKKNTFSVNPPRKDKNKNRKSSKRSVKNNVSSGKKKLKKNGMIKEAYNSEKSISLKNYKSKEKNACFNYQITEKDILESHKQQKGIIIRPKKQKHVLNRENNNKRKFSDNSHQTFIRYGNKFNSKNAKSVNNISININNSNSIQVYHQNPKVSNNRIEKPPKTSDFLSFFKGNNFKDFELNDLPYEKAVVRDKRSFLRFYWQLLRREHLIISTFLAWEDNNILSIKLSKFMFALALDFAVNVFFFNDDSMHKIYLDYGKYNFIAQIPQILYSTLASEALDVFLRYLALIEKDLYKISKAEKNKNQVAARKRIFKILKCMRIKIFFYFVVTFFFMCLFWYFVAAFCAVYKNTQSFLLKDSMVSLLLSLLYPFGLYLFPTTFRIISLRDKKKRLGFFYKLSDLIPLI